MNYREIESAMIKGLKNGDWKEVEIEGKGRQITSLREILAHVPENKIDEAFVCYDDQGLGVYYPYK